MIILKSMRPGGVSFRGVIGRGGGAARAALASAALRKPGAVKKSSVFAGVIGGSVRREHVRARLSAARDALSKSGAAASASSGRAPFSILSALSKKSIGHAARAGGGSLSKAVGAAAAERPGFRAGQSVEVGGCIGTVVGNELRGGEPWVKVRLRGRIVTHPEAGVSPSKPM